MPSTTNNNNTLHNNASSSCDDIRTLKAQLAAQSETIRRLQDDMQALNMKYVAEIERAAETLYEKDMVEQELEELSCRLFEQANDMVAQEKRAKYALENQLRKTQEQLLAEQNQVRDLRLQQQQDIVLQRSTSSSISTTSCSSCPVITGGNITSSLSSLGTTTTDHNTRALTEYYSPTIMEAFKEFVKQSTSTTTPPSSNKQQQRVPLIKMHQQYSFLKICQEDDIEPCLRFGLQSRWSIKKIIDYLLKQPCFIEKIDSSTTPISADHCGNPSPAYNRPLWERWIDQHHSNTSTSTHSTPIVGCCSACGEPTSELDYRFRLDINEDWYRIDRYCRDRLVAVCEFYVFIRNIYMGFYADRDVSLLYEETVRLRLQIFYARMGTMREINPPPLIHNATDNSNKEEQDEDNVSLHGSVSTVSTSSSSGTPPTPTHIDNDNTANTNNDHANDDDNDTKRKQGDENVSNNNNNNNNHNTKKQQQRQPMVRSHSWTISSSSAYLSSSSSSSHDE